MLRIKNVAVCNLITVYLVTDVWGQFLQQPNVQKLIFSKHFSPSLGEQTIPSIPLQTYHSYQLLLHLCSLINPVTGTTQKENGRKIICHNQLHLLDWKYDGKKAFTYMLTHPCHVRLVIHTMKSFATSLEENLHVFFSTEWVPPTCHYFDSLGHFLYVTSHIKLPFIHLLENVGWNF